MAEKMIMKKNSKEDDVLSLIDEELSKKSKGKKGSSSGSVKAGPSMSSTRMTPGPSTSKTGDTRSTGNDSEMMAMLKAIQGNQTKQNEKLNNLSDKVNEMYEYDVDGNENEYEVEEEEEDEPPAKRQKK